MNGRDSAAWEVHQFLTALGIPYAIIGGVAVQRWGEPRFTQDVDLTVAAPLDDPETFVQQVLDRFSPRLEDALTFALRNRVILVQATNGYNLDIALGLPGYEDEVIQRAIDYELEPGKAVRLCSAEDLIIHKAVAGRSQDVRDIEGIIYRQGDVLDVGYIRQWLHGFAEILGKPAIVELFESPWRGIRARK
ncbi:MAG: hypothetical protein ACRDIB_20175 [Ardenticatenaceae bacterium]